MATAKRKIEVEFSLTEWHKFRDQLKDGGEAGKKALEQIDKAAKGVNPSLKAVNEASRQVQGAMRDMATHSGRLGNVLTSMGGKWLVVAAGIGAVSLAIGKGLHAYAEEERAQLRLQNVLRATGGAAGVTAQQIDHLAERLERTTFFKKEDILQAAGALTTFKAVSGEAFESTIKLATDMAEVFGGDVVTNARTLGKALQDPADGLSALKRVAGELSPEVLKTAEAFEKAGDHASAVNTIITELEGRLGGSAQAAANGYAGSIDNLADSLNDLLKSIGAFAAESGLVTYFQNLGHGIDAITEAIRQYKRITSDPQRAAWEDKSAAEGFVTEATVVKGWKFDSKGRLVAPTAVPGKSKSVLEEEEKAAEQAAVRRLKLHREIADLEKEHQAFVDGGQKELEIQQKLNQFLHDTKGLRQDEVKALGAKYEQLLRIAAADQEARKQAEKAAAEISRAYEHAFDRISDSFADMLMDGEFSAKSLVQVFKQAAAEIAAALVFRPIVGSIASSLFPGISGSVAGGAAAPGGGFSLSNLTGGLGPAWQFLTGGAGAHLGGTFVSIGDMLGLSGIDNAASLFSLGQNFTPLSGLAGFGGNFAADLLLGNRGIGSSIGGTIGGIAGTAAFGPLGALAGSFLGNAIGGLFGGGGKKHPAASFMADMSATGALGNYNLTAKHLDTAQPRAVADALSAFLQTLTAASGAKFNTKDPIYGHLGDGGDWLEVHQNKFQVNYKPSDASSTAEAFRQMALYLAKTADVVNDDLVKALEGVTTSGKDAATVLAEVTAQFQGVTGLRAFVDALMRDPSTSNLSPEEQRKLASQFFTDTVGKAGSGGATLADVQASALAFLQSSQGYAGRASGVYATDLADVRTRLLALDNLPQFASGGEFLPGAFKVHPNEIVMTSNTPGKVLNPAETRQALSGNDMAMMRLMADLKQMFGALLQQQQAMNSHLARVTAQ